MTTEIGNSASADFFAKSPPVRGGLLAPIPLVRRAQREVSRGRMKSGLRELLERETWRQAAQILTAKYFTQTVKKGQTVAHDIEQSYLAALYLFPLQQHWLKGTYRPSWSRTTALTWLRTAINDTTDQWLITMIELPDRGADAIPVATANVMKTVPFSDANGETLENLFSQMAYTALEDGRRSSLARLILEPWAYADFDREMDQRFEFSAQPRRRQQLRAAKRGSVSYLRIGRQILMAASIHAANQMPEYQWIDLRNSDGFQWLDYTVFLHHGDVNQWVAIGIQPQVIRDTKAMINGILSMDTNPSFRLHLVNKELRNFEGRHKAANGAVLQFHDINTYVRQRVNTVLGANLFNAKNKLYPIIVSTKFQHAALNPFLDLDRPESEWFRLFSPFRND